MGRRLVDDDSHRAFGRMCADINHAPRKAIIAHGRHRNQHLPVQISALRTLALLGFGRLANGHRLGFRLAGIRAGGRRLAVTSRAGLATEFHVEMLPDWMPIATTRGRPGHASFMPHSSPMRRKANMCNVHICFQRWAGSDMCPLTMNSVVRRKFPS